MGPHRPTCCPLHEDGGEECIIQGHHWRERVTGPGFPLLVVYCQTHEVAFTLYPPGHRPYGQQAVVPLAPNGSRLLDGEDEEDDNLSRELGGSMFDAALDAAKGRFWARYSRSYSDAGARSVGWKVDEQGGGDRYRSTQERQLAKLLELVGVAKHQDSKMREEVADLLGVEHMLLEEHMRRIDLQTGPVSRGEAVCSVLRAMPKGMRYERLVAGGCVAGLWGEARHWDPIVGVSRRLPFRITGTRAPPRR